MPAHPLSVRTTITTATFEGDSPVAGNLYGDDIPVEIVNHDALGAVDSAITIKIGDNMFRPCDLTYLLQCIDAYKKAIEEWRKNK